MSHVPEVVRAGREWNEAISLNESESRSSRTNTDTFSQVTLTIPFNPSSAQSCTMP